MLTKVLARCGIVSVLMVASHAGAQTTVTSFRDVWGDPADVTTVKSRFGEKLMIVNGGTVESVGLDGTNWHIGFVDYRDGQMYFVGYAQNFKKVLPDYAGWMWGLYDYDMNFDDDKKPDDLIIVQDVLGDGIGTWDNGGWTPGGDDMVYGKDDVLFGPGRVRGDIAQLPGYGESRYPPLMTISVSDTPIVGDLNDDGFVGIEDLNIVLGSWNQNVPPGNPLADPSGDGFVGIEDLNFVLGGWNAGTPPAFSLPEPTGMAALGILGISVLLRRDTVGHTH